MSASTGRKYGISDFFSGYFSNFGRLIIVNLLFSAPLAVLIGVMALLIVRFGELSWFVIFLLIPLMSPFFAGLTNVCRKLVSENSFRPVKDFFKGIKENWLFFLINSIFFYALTAGMFMMITINRESGGGPVLVYLIIMSLTSLVFLMMEFSALVMAASVDIGFTDILRNSLVLIGKGITNHLKTLFALLFAAFVLYTIIATIPSMIVSLIVVGVLTALLLPALLTYIVVYNSYQTIEKHVIMPFRRQTERDEQIRLEKEKEDSLTIDELLPLSKGDPEEYVFLNGKTLKRKTILKMIEVRQNKE